MKIFYDCIPCFIKQTLDVSRLSLPGEEEVHGCIMKSVLKELADLEMQMPPPVAAARFHAIIKEMTGNYDPYKEVKEKYNKEALSLYPELKELLNQSQTPFETAVKLAIAGNIIDFGHRSISDDLKLFQSVKEVLAQIPFINHIQYLKEEIEKADNILYLADNTGEVVFDRIFIEYLIPKNITLAVRKYPIINDANYEDAKFVGLTDLVNVIDNGTAIPGTYLPACSEEFRQIFNEADLIISKGQGNYETLNDVNKNIFFLLRAKCDCVSEDIGCNLNDIVVISKKYAKISV